MKGSSPTIKGYRILRRLEDGGQGRVWLATRDQDGVRIAIKVLRLHEGSSGRSRARFEQSIATLASLDHPGIVRNVEHGVLATGELWHATEFVPGRSLLEHIEHLDQLLRHERGSESRLPVREIVALFVRICEAVEAAHRVGVIHRDLKPSNIIVGDDGRPALLDFGHATTPEFAASSNLTISGEFLGTPIYASPEQVLCRPGTIDVRTDVYALGVILYQCLTGTFPYDVLGSLAEIFEQIQYAEPAPLRTHVPWIDRDLQAIVLQALAKRREDRYQSVSELRADLDRYMQGDSVQARRGGTVYAFAKFLRRHKILAVSAGVVAIVSIAYAISMTVLYQRAVVAEGKAEVSADEARQQFVAAHESLEFVISQIETKLDRVAGTRELRKELLAECYHKLRGLEQWHTTDPRIRAQLAAVHRRLGSIAMDLDRHEEAASEWKHSYEILDQLVKENSSDPSLWEQLSIAHVLLGDVAKRREQWDVARQRYDQALQIDLRLAREHPENDRFMDNLSWSYERFGGPQFCPDASARDDYRRKRHELAQRLFDRNPSSAVRMNNLCISHLMQAKALGDSDRPAFVDHVQAAFDLANRLVAAEPLNGQFAFTLAMTLTARLDEPLRVGDVETARLILERLIAVCIDLDKRDTDSHWARAARARLEGTQQALQKLQGAQVNAGADLRCVMPRYDGL